MATKKTTGKKATSRFAVTVTHHPGDDPTHHVGRFTDKHAAEQHFSKKHPSAHKIKTRMC